MGKNSRARRAAKLKKRSRQRNRQGGRTSTGAEETRASSSHSASSADAGFNDARADPSWSQPSAEESVAALWRQAHHAHRDRHALTDAVQALCLAPADLVDQQAEELLLDLVASCWGGGWQPLELARQGRRATRTAGASRLVTWAIKVDDLNRPAATIDARWQAQAAQLDVPAMSGRPGWFSAWANNEGLDRRAAIRGVLDALAAISEIPRLDILIPPPGSSDVNNDSISTGRASGVDADPVLERIRALLAKAESSEFEAESASFTAKAQELITRHAIDLAVLAHAEGAASDEPTMIRVLIEPPYVDAKSLLLHVVAEAGRCRSVIYPGLDMCAVMGTADDLAAVEMLFTSLLVQAQTALADAARHAPPGTRTRSQSFRSAFLTAFAGRIAERLAAINDHVFAEAEQQVGSSFQLVLRDRSARVDAAFDERFANVEQARVRGGFDGAGFASGRSAAERAKLNLDLTDPSSTSPGSAERPPSLLNS